LPKDSVCRLVPAFLFLNVITERGDKKKAITHLRVGATQKSHHFSTFRTGMWLGSSIPAMIIGFIACTLCFPDADDHRNVHVAFRSTSRSHYLIAFMEHHTFYLLYFVNPYVTCVARRFEPDRMGQGKDQLCVHIWCA
jgi:hypothetical protein